MKIADHLEKARAFDDAVARLDPLQDSELYIVFLMRAGTNRVNAALHSLGITAEEAGNDGRICDLNHTYKPRLEAVLPETLQRAFAHLAFLENLRPDCVRGCSGFDARLATACSGAYERIRAETEPAIRARDAA